MVGKGRKDIGWVSDVIERFVRHVFLATHTLSL
jgi:hypothetical protein